MTYDPHKLLNDYWFGEPCACCGGFTRVLESMFCRDCLSAAEYDEFIRNRIKKAILLSKLERI